MYRSVSSAATVVDISQQALPFNTHFAEHRYIELFLNSTSVGNGRGGGGGGYAPGGQFSSNNFDSDFGSSHGSDGGGRYGGSGNGGS